MPKLPEPGNNNPIVPAGTYKVRISSFEHVVANTGTAQIRWKAEIVDHETESGKTLVEHTAMTDKAIWKVSNLIGATNMKFTPNVDTDSQYFTGLCNATVGRISMWVNQEGQDNKGNPRNNVVGFAVSDSQEPEEFSEIDEAVPAEFED